MSENHDPEQALQSSGSGAEDGDKGVETVLNVDVMESSSETAADTVSENDSVLQSSEVSSGFVPSEPNQVSVAFIHMQKLQKFLDMNFPCQLEKKMRVSALKMILFLTWSLGINDVASGSSCGRCRELRTR